VVAADNFSGSAAIITHLITDHGKRRLFHVDGPPDSPDAVQRRLALEHVLRGHPQCQLIGSTQGIFSVRSGEQAGEELLARHRGALPEAVVCANDQMAIGVLRAFAAADVRVPEEVAVVGFDDIYPSSLFDPPLTTVHQPMRMLGEQACARVLERIADPGLSPTVELLPTELVLRSSCGCPPGTVTRRPVETLKPPRPRSAVARTGSRGTRQGGPKAARPARQAAKA
jgi:LacI family transcriptional regulator